MFLADAGLSGPSVRGVVNNATQPVDTALVANVDIHTIEETVKQAADFALKALDLTGQALGNAVGEASSKVFENAAEGNMVGESLAQSSFSWGGYFQAIGILCILMAALWFAVWAIRRYGKFNFMPRPGSLPREALFMEAQMPLGPKKGLMVVRFLNKRLLLGVTDQQISLLVEEKVTDERPKNDFQRVIEEAGNAAAHSGIDDSSS